MTETRQQKRIRQILNQAEEAKDTSLRGHALKRATENDVPRTLTAWEWEQWYIDNGKPEAHPPESKSSSQPWWRRWLGLKPHASQSSRRNCVRSVNEDEEF
mgnify:CR=1 FL=1